MFLLVLVHLALVWMARLGRSLVNFNRLFRPFWLALAVLLTSFDAQQLAGQDVERLPSITEEFSVLPAEEEPPAKEAVEEVIEAPVEFTWYQPGYYLDPEIWDGSIEVGVNGSSGNSDTFNISAGYDLKRETERHVFTSDLKYFNASTKSIQTQNYAIFNSGVEFKSIATRWSLFARTQMQFDEFQDFDLRVVLNSGLAYRFWDSKTNKGKVRVGAGATRDFGGVDDLWKPEASFGYDLERRLSKRQKLVSKMDIYPAWEDFSDYRLVSDSGWEVLLDEETNLSLKIGVVYRLDSTPSPGTQRNDVNYVALLIWKL